MDVTTSHPASTTAYYLGEVGWRCKDRRFLIRDTTSATNTGQESITSRCRWSKEWSVSPSQLECRLTYCDNATEAPNTSHGYNFTWDGAVIPIGQSVTYRCRDGWRFEADTDTKDQAGMKVEVKCGTDGYLGYPTTWTTCRDKTECPAPPPPPENGSLSLEGDPSLSQPYLTQLVYSCTNGSQYDTDSSGAGDTPGLVSSCQWRGAWHPWTSMPSCIITHCTSPPLPPSHHHLEELTTSWTPTNSPKVFQCQGYLPEESRHTRFFQQDRSLSSLSLPCRPDGQVTFDGFWPTCLVDIECPGELPSIPTHPLYLLVPGDDGRVVEKRTPHPSLSTITTTHLAATSNISSLAHNYGAELAYFCGLARKFQVSGTHQDTHTLTCGWDASWAGELVLPPCDWVSCLRPPAPPPQARLRLTGWDGRPVPFGGQAVYVCDHGTWFVDDSAQESVIFECQDGSQPGTARGLFNTPDEDSNWPLCSPAPLCPPPPTIPIPSPPPPSDQALHTPLVLPLEEKVVEQSGGLPGLTLTCPTFLTIMPTSVTRYGMMRLDLMPRFPASTPGECLDPMALEVVREYCLSSSSCTIHPNISLASDCPPVREMVVARVAYSCGKLCGSSSSYQHLPFLNSHQGLVPHTLYTSVQVSVPPGPRWWMVRSA